MPAKQRRRREAGEEVTSEPTIAPEPPVPDLLKNTPPFRVVAPGPMLTIGRWHVSVLALEASPAFLGLLELGRHFAAYASRI